MGGPDAATGKLPVFQIKMYQHMNAATDAKALELAGEQASNDYGQPQTARTREQRIQAGQYASYRGISYSAAFSDSLIRKGRLIYPVKTDITLSLEMATQVYKTNEKHGANPLSAAGIVAAAAAKSQAEDKTAAFHAGELRHLNLPKHPLKTWY